MDLLYGLQGAAAAAADEDMTIEDELPEGGIPPMDGKLPSAEELLKMLDGMTGLSDEDKESLRADLLKNINGENAFAPPPAEPFTSQALILFAMLALVALIFGNLI